jgi:hypothetical protein
MDWLKKMLAIAGFAVAVTVAPAALVGCEDSAGDDIGDAVDDAGDDMEDAGEDMQDSMEDAGDDMEDSME